jgi:hypothetical protein
MVLSEHELRDRLAASADNVNAPSFTIDGLTSRIRRRRTVVTGIGSGALLAIAAIAVALSIALSGPAAHTTATPPRVPFKLSYAVTVNGQASASQENEPPPSFTVASGERLSIRVSVIVPAHDQVTSLWLGIAEGAFGPGLGEQRPIGVQPILAHVQEPLTPGRHSFNLSWTVPETLHSGATVQLAATWSATQEQMRVGDTVAELGIPSPN